jgi:hypothetical protein
MARSGRDLAERAPGAPGWRRGVDYAMKARFFFQPGGRLTSILYQTFNPLYPDPDATLRGPRPVPQGPGHSVAVSGIT